MHLKKKANIIYQGIKALYVTIKGEIVKYYRIEK